MAYFALMNIHTFLHNDEEMIRWSDLLDLSGGKDAIDEQWIEAVEKHITVLSKASLDDTTDTKE